MEETVDVRLKSPFTAVIAGPTGCGKTNLMMSLIRNRETVCTEPPEEILYCYGAWQEKYESLRDVVVFNEGLVDVENDIANDGKARWLVIDDLMEEVSGKQAMNNLFTKHSHHRNISIFFLAQNLFKKENRTASLNTKYMFIFKNPRDKQVIESLARQAFPGKVAAVRQAYEIATEEPHSFLLIDMSQTASERVRLLANYLHPTKPIVALDVNGKRAI